MMVSEPFRAYQFNPVSEQDSGRIANGNEIRVLLETVENGLTGGMAYHYWTSSTR
jgi:hypothetical protein